MECSAPEHQKMELRSDKGGGGDLEEDGRKEYTNLLNIPKEIIFPLELSIYLKERLQCALEEIFRLKKQLFNQDYERNCRDWKSEKSKSDKYFETKDKSDMSNPQMATKVVELSKKLRDVTAEKESMKTRMKQLMSENEQLKSERLLQPKIPLNLTDGDSLAESKAKSEQQVTSASQQLALTQKMMDYRRQSQQLRLELRTALKALSQEVGEGSTPQTVLHTVTTASWRGRQQQILALQQKVSELQLRLSQAPQIPPAHPGAGEPCADISSLYDDCCSDVPTGDMHDDKSVRSMHSNTSASQSATQRRLLGLQQQEKNKHELLEKTNHQLECTKQELKTALLNMKASKARGQILEDHVRSQRNQIEGLEGKLGGKQMELQEAINEINRLNHELTIIKDRMKTIRDTAAAEMKDTRQALLKEKANSSRLQKMLDNYNERFSKMTSELEELKVSLSAFENAPADDLEARKRLQFLELQFEEMKQGMQASENECKRFLALVDDSVGRLEEERILHSATQRHLIKSFAVIDHAEQCINLCLEVGQISDKKVLETVEDLKSMRRELKTGDLFHLQPMSTSDVRKLKSRISILSKEVHVLESAMKKSATERKKDLQNFAIMAEKIRQEYLTALTNSVMSKLLGRKTPTPVNNKFSCETTS